MRASFPPERGIPHAPCSLGKCTGQYDVVVGGDVFGLGETTASEEDWTLRSPALSSSYSACPGFVTSPADGAVLAVGVAALVVEDWFKQHPTLQSRDSTLCPDRENPIAQQQDYVSGEVAPHARCPRPGGGPWWVRLVYARHAPAGIGGHQRASDDRGAREDQARLQCRAALGPYAVACPRYRTAGRWSF